MHGGNAMADQGFCPYGFFERNFDNIVLMPRSWSERGGQMNDLINYLTFNEAMMASAVSFHLGKRVSVQLKVTISTFPSTFVKK